MRTIEQISTSPIAVEKSVRREEIRALTSGKAGQIIPVAFVPLLREDRVSRGSLNISLDMNETIHPLMNSVNVTAYAHLVPNLAFTRFQVSGIEGLNRSYQGIPEPYNDTVIPWNAEVSFNSQTEFWRTLGVHMPEASKINRAPLEAYNKIVNFRRKSRSDRLPERADNDNTLAQAFWKNPNLTHVVPSFDQAAMDGEVELQFSSTKLNLNGFGQKVGSSAATADDVAVYELEGGGQIIYEHSAAMSDPAFAMETSASGIPNVFAELADAGVKLSLANMELAKRTAAFAKLRDRFHGLDDDHIIDLLMEGIRVPDEAMKQPILLDKQSTIFGYTERQAMDGANLDVSVTTGKTQLQLNFRTPPINTGGVIVITLEIVPEQLYERMWDEYLGQNDPSRLPNFMRDYLDPEKVDVVQNQYVDVDHDFPDATFGYAPLNHMWQRSFARVGGKYYRRSPDQFVEDRQRFWSIETINPTLTDDFYLCPEDFPHPVFVDTISDNFEILTVGGCELVGNTVFGKGLQEDYESYDKIMEQVDTSRIVQENVQAKVKKGDEE